jgi:hypothetical protein
MGKDNEANVIGLDLASLTREPQAVFELGREDIVEGRPGQILMSEVKKFQADGGFRALEEIRDQAYQAEKALDAKTSHREFKEFAAVRAFDEGSKAGLDKENAE